MGGSIFLESVFCPTVIPPFAGMTAFLGLLTKEDPPKRVDAFHFPLSRCFFGRPG
jgi:hypothetical protein